MYMCMYMYMHRQAVRSPCEMTTVLTVLTVLSVLSPALAR